MSKPKAKTKVKEITFTVVGLHHRLTPSSLHELEASSPLKVELRREPDNLYDENAIAVWALERPFREMQIGYLRKEVARDIAPKMDRNEFDPQECWITDVENERESQGGSSYVATLLVKL